MDSKDLRILSLLQKNGRMPISELAIKLNMSDTPCLRRVKKMEESGVISGYTANISADSIGFFGGIINSFENEYEPNINRKIKINLINILKKIIFL